MAVLVVCTDLVFRSKIREAGQAQEILFAKNFREALEKAEEKAVRMVIVDLCCVNDEFKSFIQNMKSKGENRVIVFGSHVDKEGFQRAEDAGADEIIARSMFVKHLPSLLSN